MQEFIGCVSEGPESYVFSSVPVLSFLFGTI